MQWAVSYLISSHQFWFLCILVHFLSCLNLVAFEFKAVPGSVPSFYWMKNVLLLGPHKICHLRVMIISSFLLVTREQEISHTCINLTFILTLFIQLNVSLVSLRQYMFVCDCLFLFQGSIWATDCFVEICAGTTVFKGYGLQYARSE